MILLGAADSARRCRNRIPDYRA